MEDIVSLNIPMEAFVSLNIHMEAFVPRDAIIRRYAMYYATGSTGTSVFVLSGILVVQL